MYSVNDIRALGRKVAERNQAEHIVKQGRHALSWHSTTLQKAAIMRLQRDLDIDIANVLIGKHVTKESLQAGCRFA